MLQYYPVSSRDLLKRRSVGPDRLKEFKSQRDWDTAVGGARLDVPRFGLSTRDEIPLLLVSVYRKI